MRARQSNFSQASRPDRRHRSRPPLKGRLQSAEKPARTQTMKTPTAIAQAWESSSDPDSFKEPLFPLERGPSQNQIVVRAGVYWIRNPIRLRRSAIPKNAAGELTCEWSSPRTDSTTLVRKEVIQPQVPLRLPCYDFAPVTGHTMGGCLPCGLAHRLPVQ